MEHMKTLIKAMLECFNQHGAQQTPTARKNYGKQAHMHAHTCTQTRMHTHPPTHPCIGNVLAPPARWLG
jgi:hypothetical protein